MPLLKITVGIYFEVPLLKITLGIYLEVSLLKITLIFLLIQLLLLLHPADNTIRKLKGFSSSRNFSLVELFLVGKNGNITETDKH